jgi:Carboxypeptidase regulatory-like domain
MGRSSSSMVGFRSALSFSLGLFVLAGSAFAAESPNREARIEISVADQHEKAIREACITLVPENGSVLFGKSDRSGKLRWAGLPPGKYRVVVKVERFVAEKKEVVLSEGENRIAFSLAKKN